MGIKNKRTGEYRTVPVATLQAFHEFWLPASEALGLQLVSHLHDGSLTTVRSEQVSAIIDELARLRASVAVGNFWTHGSGRREWIIGRIDGTLGAFETTDSTECEYDFG